MAYFLAKTIGKCAAITMAVSNGFHYSACYKAPADSSKPHILFVHGFPSSSYDWRHQVEYFADQGYGIIAPDLLGYGETSKPDRPEDYTPEAIGDSLVEVVQKVTKQQAPKVIGVGHDWGSIVLARLTNFHPDIFLGYSFLAVPYLPAGFFNLTAYNDASIAATGQAILGYNNFFNESKSGRIIDTHQRSFVDLIYPEDLIKTWTEHLGPLGACEAWLKNNTMGPRATYITPEEFAIHDLIFAPATGGYAPALNSYRGLVRGLNVAAENALTAAQQVTTLPTSYIGVTLDPEVNIPLDNSLMEAFAGAPVLSNVTAGHWVQLEQPTQVNSLLANFFQSKGLSG